MEKARFRNLSILFSLWRHISIKRKKHLIGLIAIMLINAIAELFSLATIIPFIAVVTSPDTLWNIVLLRDNFVRFGYNEASEIVLPIVILFCFAYLLVVVFKLVNIWLIENISGLIGTELGMKSLKRTLSQPYEVFLARNSSELINTFHLLIDDTVIVIRATLQIITSIIIVIFILFGFLFAIKSLALFTAIIFTICSLCIVIPSNKKLYSNGKARASIKQNQIKALQECLGGIRDVMIDNSQKIYLDMYHKSDKPLRRKIAENAFLRFFARYTLEAVGIIYLSLITYWLIIRGTPTVEILTLTGATALGAQKLIPAINMICTSWGNLNEYMFSVNGVIKLLEQPFYEPIISESNLNMETIVLDNISYAYPGNDKVVLNKINLKVKKGERLAIVGTTGSGKSTLMDVILGLINPTKGQIRILDINGRDLIFNRNTKQWRSSIAHVPQSIFLTDTTIAENIAFGVEPEGINLNKVKKAANAAMISDFIESQNLGYNSLVGERGVKLSGGQKQRIGIARALYREKNILLLDEATSALDETTESDVIKSIQGLSRDITIIIIAHRLSTISNCDRVIKLNQGNLINL